jgi:ABC-2 type transport system permease protein
VSRRLTIVAHELRTQLTSASFVALMLLLVAATSTLNPVAMIPGGSAPDQPVRAIANSVYALSPTFAMSGFFVYPFFVALMAGLSVLRDDEAGVSELLHSTPLTHAEYLWAKFAGVTAALFIAIMVHVAVVITFRELGIGGVARGPFALPAYLIAAGVFVVPGVLWMAGLTFAIGARTKAPMAVYVLPVALFMLEFVLLWNWHPRGIDPVLDALLMIVDPTGLRWLSHSLFTDDRGIIWYNSAPLAIDRVLMFGRVVTLVLPLAAVALLAYGRRRARTTIVRRLLVRRLFVRGLFLRRRTTVAPAMVRSFGGLDAVPMMRRTPTPLRATMTVLAAELRSLRRQPAGYLFAAFLFAVVTEVGGAEPDAYGSTAVLTAGSVAINTLPAVTVLTCLFLLFVIVESLHRDRATGFEAIVFSSPVPTMSFIMGKALAAIVLVGVFTTVCVVSGSLLLLAQSGTSVSLWPLLLVFGAVLGPTYVLWTAFVTATMALVRSRTGALAVGFVALLLTAAQFIRGSMTWVTNWPLWGSLRWTEFALFPLDGEALLLNRLLALGLAVALFGAARLLFVRTERDPAASGARRTPAAIGRLALRASPLVALPVFTGAFLAVRVHNAYDGPVVERTAVAYEATNQRTWGSVIPAVIQHVDISVDIDPTRRALHVAGRYTLANRTTAPMTTVPFTVPSAFGRVSWRVGGVPTNATGADGLAVLSLATPLAPGDTVHVGFQYEARINDGVSRNGGPVDAFVLPSSVLLSTHRGDFLPVPGYRARASATVQPVGNAAGMPDTTTNGAGYFNRGWSFTATMRVRAPRDLTVNAVGQQTALSTVGNETITTWETREPVSALALVGAAYAVRREEGVAVYHHPRHTRSLDVMVGTLAAARRHYAAWFHPYPWSELRLSEYADLSSQATSYPTNIAFSEGLGFLTTPGDSGGLAFAVTAHEAAHQWWGHLLTAGTGPGTGLLVEGMADYATLLLYDTERGAASRRAFATLLEQQYLAGRQASRERALVDTDESSSADEAVLQKKGAWAMWMLHQHLGAERTFAGLREFIAAHRAPGRFATPEGLLRALRHQASDTIRFDRQVTQWFRSTQLPSFSVQDAHCTEQVGAWVCRATLRNTGSGSAHVDVAARRDGADGMPGDLVSVQLAAGASAVVQWRLPQRPDRVVVDPDVRVLQVGRERGWVAVASP